MRILFDECVPLRLRDELPDHEVRSVPEMGWSSQENGALLALVLVARRDKLEFLRPLVPELRRALAEVKPGDRRVGA